ncbi:M56 family metallopeptidase [Paenibacillus flagellatus]|uniref:Peptidase M56 domain-containing protein n=1 Tax=Paenibacillus flagellatus TaxID=2211139 RepID=A0A2V5JYV7_9BACL|nr:M56 family metallopeptidase [Paenibacillus flagellatus]PYI52085.1 hypothetical protein DLM86_21620 [Paenibacillus flagellatus]
MTFVCLSLLVMSAVTSALYLVMKLCARWTHRYFTASWHYYSYNLLYTFLLIPYFGLLPFLGIKVPDAIRNDAEARYAGEPEVPFASQAGDASSWLDRVDWPDWLPYILPSGTIVFIAVIAVQMIRLHRRLFRLCERVDDPSIDQELEACGKRLGLYKPIPVYWSPYAGTPFLYGLFKPRIVLPASMGFAPEQYRHVFLHELTHYKRRDIWVKFLLLLMNAVHWFNPFAYAARRDIDRYGELSCDERLVRSMSGKEKRRYCELLLQVLWNAADRRDHLSTAFGNERKYMERRIDMILKSECSGRTRAVRTLAVATTLSMALIGTAAVHAASPKAEPQTVQQPRTAPEPQTAQDAQDVQEPRTAQPNKLAPPAPYPGKERPTYGYNISVQHTDGTIETYDKHGNVTVKTAKELTYEELKERIGRLQAAGISVPKPYFKALNDLLEKRPQEPK